GPHEEDRISVLRSLDPLAPIPDALGRRHAAAIHRSRRCGRTARRGRRLFSRPSFCPPACLALSIAGGRRRQDQPHRDRHRRDRHALREPALHGRGRRRRRSDRGRQTATWHQPRLAGTGDRRLALFRLPAGGGPGRRRDGAAPCGGLPRPLARRRVCRAQSAAD
ncbi:hypothetical protein KXV85_005013, partial [Aspergillus fumigatus]